METTISNRIAVMQSQRARGLTLKQIGDNFGVTPERVRQLLSPFPNMKRVASQAASERRAKMREEKLAQILSQSEQIDVFFTQVYQIQPVVDHFPELDGPLLIKYLKDKFKLAPRTQRKLSKWTDEQILVSLRLAAEVTPSMSVKQYVLWRQDATANGIESPSSATVVNRFGGWNNAVLAAGLQTRPSRNNYQRKWTDEDLEGVLSKFVNDQRATGGSLRVTRFREWLAAQPAGSVPSEALVRTRVGDWSERISQVNAMIEVHDALKVTVLPEDQQTEADERYTCQAELDAQDAWRKARVIDLVARMNAKADTERT